MPVNPHPITFTVYDTDNVTVLQNAICLVKNCSKKTTSSETLTNSSGIAIIDLANLPLADGQTVEYETGDVILIIAYMKRKIGNCHDAAYYEVTGTGKAQSLYLNPFPFNMKTGDPSSLRMLNITFANTNGSNAYNAKIYSFADGELLRQVQLAANATQHLDLGRGLQGRCVVVRSNQAVVVTGDIR